MTGRPSSIFTATSTLTEPESEKKEEVVVLTPFVVEGEELEGYQANSSLAGTRIRTDLKDIASAVTVITKQFLANTAKGGFPYLAANLRAKDDALAANEDFGGAYALAYFVRKLWL